MTKKQHPTVTGKYSHFVLVNAGSLNTADPYPGYGYYKIRLLLYRPQRQDLSAVNLVPDLGN